MPCRIAVVDPDGRGTASDDELAVVVDRLRWDRRRDPLRGAAASTRRPSGTWPKHTSPWVLSDPGGPKARTEWHCSTAR
jgi:hypothetical protein